MYIHIPYCLQKCHYCDFTTFSLDHRLSMNEYVDLLLIELRSRHKDVPSKKIHSIYFGGGTPSLLPTEHMLTLLEELDNLCFEKAKDTEITIEINPGTIDQQRLDLYLKLGINRFSVGVQTFNDSLLKLSGREHSAKDSHDTLRLLQKNMVNYSADILFGLPEQSLDQVDHDLNLLVDYKPPHVSAYNLTVPETHLMNKNRAEDSVQAKMFDHIEARLRQHNIIRYELSNYAKPGKESRHNLVYWNDQAYWGLGVSAHSYFPKSGSDYGIRFWNSHSSKDYQASVLKSHKEVDLFSSLDSRNIERLEAHESLTDYCHTQLRKVSGFDLNQIAFKYGAQAMDKVRGRAASAAAAGLVVFTDPKLRLSPKGRQLANLSFLEFTFLLEDLIS